MTRRDTHLDAMLRNLGATYYHTTQGTARAADVTRALESVAEEERRINGGGPAPRLAGHHHHRRWRVRDVMTSPAITIHPDAPLGSAARLMTGHNIRRLPVVDASGELIGIVSRRDLLSVFFLSDEEITAELRDAISTILLDEGEDIPVTVRDGVVTLSGTLAGRK